MWVDGHVLFDVESGASTEYAYFTGTDRPHSMRRNGQAYYYLTDQLGSVAAVADSTGTKRNTYTYDVWGYGSCSEQVGNRLRYTGREYDGATGFYYLRARYYDPATGRFLSEDPLGGLNPYAYAGNNPVSLRDPSGLDEEDGEDDDRHYDCTDPRSPGGRQIVKGEVCDLNEVRNRDDTGTAFAQMLGFFGGSNPGAGGSLLAPGRTSRPRQHNQSQEGPSDGDCYERNKLSSLFGDGLAGDIVSVVEVGSFASVGLDLYATLRKGGGALGTKRVGASGLNMVVRDAARFVGGALGRPKLVGKAIQVSDKLAPAVSTVGWAVAAFSFAYNSTIDIECRLGLIE
jgi:RHS repeat-associated protein